MGQRREEIVEIARQLFATAGVNDTSMRDLASAAGITPSSLYSHFRSKGALVDEIMQDYVSYMLDAYESAEAENDDPLERLCVLVSIAMSMLERYPAEMAIHQHTAAHLAKMENVSYAATVGQAIRQSWLGAIEAGVEQGLIRDDVPPIVLYRWLRDAAFMSFRWFDPADGLTAEDLYRGVVRTFCNGLLREPLTNRAIADKYGR